MSALPVVYVAHCLSAPTWGEMDENRRSAARWALWIGQTFRVSPVADWVWMSAALPETPENRAFGLECDCALVARCDALVMVGPRVSEGMRREAEQARAIVDWTSPDHSELLRDLPTFRPDSGAIAAMRRSLFAAIEGARS